MSRYYPVADLVAHETADYTLTMGGYRLGFTEHTWGPPTPNSDSFSICHLGVTTFTAPIPALAAWSVTIVTPILLLVGVVAVRLLLRRRATG